MSHKVLHDIQRALRTTGNLVDPGDAESLTTDGRGVATIGLRSSAAETRTLKDPTAAGQLLTLYMLEDGGDITVTASTAYDEAGNTVLVFNNVGDTVTLVAIRDDVDDNESFAWRVLTADGVGGPLIPGTLEVSVQCLLNADCVDRAFFVANRAYEVVAIREVHATAGNDAGSVNLQVTKDTSTDAPGAGTDLLTNNTNAGFNMKGTANTVQTGTLTATAASLKLAAGDRLSLDFAGTVTTLAGVVVTVTLKPVG